MPASMHRGRLLTPACRYDRNGDGVIDYAEFQQGLFPLEGDQHNKNVHRHLVRSDLVDPVPGSARGPQATVFDGLVKQEASKAAQSRLKKGPLYYSAVPSRKQMRQAHHGVNHHPPEFRTVGGTSIRDSFCASSTQQSQCNSEADVLGCRFPCSRQGRKSIISLG